MNMNKFKSIFYFSFFTLALLSLPSFVSAATPTAESACATNKNNATGYAECIKSKDVSVCSTWNISYLSALNKCDVDDTTAYEQCNKGIKSSLNAEISSLSKANLSYKDQSVCLSSAYVFVASRRAASISAKNESASIANSISNSWANGYEINYGDSPCANENIKQAVKVLGKIISIIQIVVPILLVIMAMVDIIKSIISGDDAKSRKNIKILIKRFISAVIIFFVIAIIKLVCQLVGDNSFDSCLELIAKPW